jgi:hypothetical protein
MIAKLVDLTKGKGKSLREDPVFRDFALGDSIAARLFYRRDLVTPDFSHFGAWPPSIEADSIIGLDGKLDLKQGLKAEVVITTQTQLDASNLARSIGQTRRRLGKNMLVVLFGIDWILEKFKTSAERSTVAMSLELDGRDIEELKHLAERISKMRELTSGRQGGSSPDGDAADHAGAPPAELEK